MELKWDVEEAAAAPPYVFSRDLFEKFTLAPNVKELFALLHSSGVKPEDAGQKEADAGSQPAKCDEVSDVSNALAADEPTAECKPTQKAKSTPEKNSVVSAFPEPLVPYPCFTKINAKERRSYISMLKTKNYKKASKRLIELVRNETTEFMKYLQEVSRLHADGYNYMPADAIRYTEEYFTACLDHVKSYPQVYGIQEITSLTSLKFVCTISLNFEKQILAMGKTDMVKENAIPANTPLAVDYESVAKVVPPAKKAHSVHNAISSDSNAEKLSATYEPHVCLAKEAFIQLLNNSSELTESWELPVWVRMNPGKGICQSKTAFIDAPLLKTEMSCRERSLLFHEESLKLLFSKTSTRPVFFVTGEELSFKTTPPAEDKTSRSVVTFDDTSMDFETDLTDLESFGESYKPTKKAKDQNKKKTTGLNPNAAPSQLTPSPKKPTDPSDAKKPTSPSENTPETVPEEQAETNTTLDDGGKTAVHGNEESETPSVQCPPVKRPRSLKDDQTEPDSDSDEGRLIIDHIVSPQRPSAQEPAASLEPAAPSPANPPGGKGVKKGVKRQRTSGECDQLGQILKMQDAMLKSTPSKSQEPVKAQVPEEKHPEVKSHSLVKTGVSSYLESRAGQEEDGSLPADTPVMLSAQKKRLLREDLQASAEDELDYDPPAEGSVFFKLYSLLDVLLMVRSSVDIAHPKHDRKTFRAVPVHILPKLEYQLCYGAESLTHTEACQLWAEKLLHSSTESFVSRINAHTSEVAQMQKLPDDWIQNLTCDFKPARCLNTLYHLLKKVSALQEGRYMLVHKPREGFVTIYKASDEAKAVRGVLNLQATHCGTPPVPPGVPWVPLDPTHVLPFHQKHNRPPCTFPPRPPPQPKVKAGPKQRQRKKACRQPQKSNASANPNDSPKTKKKQAARMKLSLLDNMRDKLLKDLQTSEDE